jgi:arsenate reductase
VTPPPIRILFLCTGNSARSIVAEALANARFGDRIAARSAGSHPKPAPHPLALETLRRHGIDTTGLASKSWEDLRDETFDLVVTLCDAAAQEPCPAFPGAPATAHWGLPDPPAADDPGAAFEHVVGVVETALRTLVDGTGDPGPRAARIGEEIVAAAG